MFQTKLDLMYIYGYNISFINIHFFPLSYMAVVFPLAE